MEERKCEYKIVAFVDDKKITLDCTAESGCLCDLVWNGKGVRNAAIQELIRTGQATGKENIKAYTNKDCIKTRT